jgi:uncharacterized paraquat-inducible protein A
MCGRALMPMAVEPPEMRQRQCVECGRSIAWDANVCMYCGHDFRPKRKASTEAHLLTGAILTLMAGILAIALLTIIVAQYESMSVQNQAIAAISYSCSSLGVIGGIAALTRRGFPIAVLGATCAIFSPAFYFAIPGLVLIANSADSFEKSARPQ